MIKRIFGIALMLLTGILLVSCDLFGADTVTTTFSTEEEVFYDVIFVNDVGVTLKTENVLEGMDATPPTNTDKDSTVQYDYSFTGWDVDYTYVSSDLTVTAVYESVIREYTVNFYDYDGTLIDSQEIEYGSSAQAPTEPSRSDTALATYEFSGWNNAFTNVTQNINVTAQYTQTSKTYIVSFYDYDGTLIEEQNVISGTNAVIPTNPTRESDDIYSYEFLNWNGNTINIVKDETVKAVYAKSLYISGDYLHQDFYDLLAQVFDLSDETIIEDNISSLIDIFETSTEEDAYYIFRALNHDFNELSEFETFADLQLLLSEYDGGILSLDTIISYLMNYLSYENNFLIGHNSAYVDWYYEVKSNYDTLSLNIANYQQIIADSLSTLQTHIALLNSDIQDTALDFYFACLDYYYTERTRLALYDELKTAIGITDANNLHTDVWQIVLNEGVDETTYNYYLTAFNNLVSTYPEHEILFYQYLDAVDKFNDASILYQDLNTTINNDTNFGDYKTYLQTARDTYIEYNNALLASADTFEYWSEQYEAIMHNVGSFIRIKDVIENTVNTTLYTNAINTIFDIIQSGIVNQENDILEFLPSILTYLSENTDMYGYIDFSGMFAILTSGELLSTIQDLSSLIDIDNFIVLPNQLLVIDSAFETFVDEYLDTFDYDSAQKLDIYNDILSGYDEFKTHVGTIITEINNLLTSIDINDINSFNTLVTNFDSYTQYEKGINQAAFINQILIDTQFSIINLVPSQIFIKYIQDELFNFDTIDYDTLTTNWNNYFTELLVLVNDIYNLDSDNLTGPEMLQIEEFNQEIMYLTQFFNSIYSLGTSD